MDPVALVGGPGGWAVVVGILIALGTAFARGLIVPRFVYDREVSRADLLGSQLQRNTEALKALTDEIRDDALDRLRAERQRDA